MREYTCAKAGVKTSRPSPKKYRKLETRTGCLACIVFHTDKDDKNWAVTKFVEEHNHPLATDSEKHLLRSNRSISEMQGNLMKNMTGARIKAVDAYNFLSEEASGVENIGFSKFDAFNFVQRERKALIESGDASSLQKILKRKQLEDNMFSYEVQTDELNRLTSFFWMDGHSKIDYDCFGDVLIFDTTYRLNKYNLACAPFIAVNNHWQNIFVGGAFIADETIESFCWVFETFLKFVGGKQPISIFTDQDQAMVVALQRVFTTSRHRLCQWHISKKAPSKVPCFNQDKIVRSYFYQCMSKCDGEEEFERCWSEMVSRGNLQANKWLADLYTVKKKWSTAFNKDILDLGILSTQRSESANICLHGSSKTTSTLVECFIGLEKLVLSWRRNEHEEDFKCKQCAVIVRFRNCYLLKHLSKLYTRKIYSLFEKTFMEGVVEVSIVDETRYDDHHIVYVTALRDEEEKRWFVSFNSAAMDAECSCRGFETKGILCQHIMRIYNIRNVRQINPKYIIKRFTCDAKIDIYLPNTPTMTEHDSKMIFRNQLMRFSYDLAIRIENCKIAKEHVISVMKDLSKTTNNMVDCDEMQKKGFLEENDTNSKCVKDPAVKRPKGAPSARMKDHWEKATKKPGKRTDAKRKVKTHIFVDKSPKVKEFKFVDDYTKESTSVTNELNFVDGFSNEQPSTQTDNPSTLFFPEDFGLDMSFCFSGIPDVFKP